ncbi:dihydrofolate reductase [Nesterenkonia sphaerica]|uniref:Dihydrofolate reductase n=1 Tax=Nesterenkonia sphaerica TaxID=1804988 RepID=A0A5R9AGS6_9MICC|nr:dihydrofolate reductase [Nesterenkonia sphaerica]TLP77097.1 dihydrofolate reductase [Nesterenkonia sphaerica]
MNGNLPVGMIWAQARSGVIGAGGAMPWHVPEDLAHFRHSTQGCPVVMGRKTWDSLPERFRPLPQRTNVVITGDAATFGRLTDSGALPAHSLPEAVEIAQSHAGGAHTVWIMGGGSVYAEAVDAGIAQLASVTQLDLDASGDTYAPRLDPEQWVLVESEPEQGWQISSTGLGYRFDTYRRR